MTNIMSFANVSKVVVGLNELVHVKYLTHDKRSLNASYYLIIPSSDSSSLAHGTVTLSLHKSDTWGLWQVG